MASGEDNSELKNMTAQEAMEEMQFLPNKAYSMSTMFKKKNWHGRANAERAKLSSLALTSTASEASDQQEFLDDEFADRNRTKIDDARSRLKKIQKMEKENEKLVKTIDEQRAVINKSRDKEKSLSIEIEKLEKECSGLRTCNHKRSAALRQKQKELDKKRKELQALQNTIKSKDECFRKYNDTLRQNEILISDMEQENSHLYEELEQQLKRHYEEKYKIATLEIGTEKLENLVRQLKEEKKSRWSKLTGNQRRTDVSTTSGTSLVTGHRLANSQQGLLTSQRGLSASRKGLLASQQELSSRQQGLSTSQRGLSASKQGLLASQQELSASQVGLSASRQRLSTSYQGLSASREGLSASRQELSTSQRGLSASREGLSASLQELSTSQRGLSASRKGLSASQQKLSSSQQGLSSSQQGFLNSQQGLSTSREGLSSSQQGISTSQQGLSASQQGLQTSQQGISTCKQGLSINPQWLSTRQQGISTIQHELMTSQQLLYVNPQLLSSSQQGFSTSQQLVSINPHGLSTKLQGLSTGRPSFSTSRQGFSTSQHELSPTQQGVPSITINELNEEEKQKGESACFQPDEEQQMFQDERLGEEFNEAQSCSTEDLTTIESTVDCKKGHTFDIVHQLYPQNVTGNRKTKSEDVVETQISRDNWETCLKETNYNGIKYLLQEEISPPNYETFKNAAKFLSEREEDLKIICRIVSQHILRNIPHAKVVYPAKSPKNQKIYVVVLSNNPSDRKYFEEFPLKVKYAYTKSEEEQYVRRKETSNVLHFHSKWDRISITNVIAHAREQFSKHPNVSRISYSFYKSKSFGEANAELEYKAKGCVVIFVYLKKWIPVGMDAFPKVFEGYSVDVRQDAMMKMHFSKVPSDKIIKIGGGTIQGHLRKRGSSTPYALTSAHAVVGEETLEKMLDEKTPYIDNSDNRFVELGVQNGTVEAAAYQESPHVDVAAIALNAPLVEKEVQFDWIKHGFRRTLTFNGRMVQYCSVETDDIVLKFGETTGLTFGFVRDPSAEISDVNQTDLIEIWSLDPENISRFATALSKGHPVINAQEIKGFVTVFSDVGDSGAFVYAVNPNAFGGIFKSADNRFFQNDDIALVGMVTFGEDGKTYATDLKKSLKALKNNYEFS